MYVGHVAAGIASMCHRGNHAGNAEAHLTALPSCIQLPPSYSVYIYCLRASTNRVSSTALSFPRSPLRTTLSLSLRFSQQALTRKFVRYGRVPLITDFINGRCRQHLFKEEFLVLQLLLQLYTIIFLPFLKNKIFICKHDIFVIRFD